MTSATRDDSPSARFRRSSFCLDGNCVEAATLPGDDVALRDSKDVGPDAPVLRFTPTEWDAFVEGVLDGQFTRDALRAHADNG